LWTTRHRSGRTLVPKLDFLTDIGHVTPSGSRAELGYTGGGPQWLITELGVFDYGPDGHARLRATWPDVTVGDVRDATGFELRVELEHGILHPPNTAELAALRAVDPLGVRRLEFGPDELKRRFDHHGSTPCAC
jgi:glutaconate CoA-transferase subunit B